MKVAGEEANFTVRCGRATLPDMGREAARRPAFAVAQSAMTCSSNTPASPNSPNQSARNVTGGEPERVNGRRAAPTPGR